MGLVITDVDKSNPPIEVKSGKVLVMHKGYFIEILQVDRGVVEQVLTVPRAVEIEVVP
jgi:hypothetical protein